MVSVRGVQIKQIGRNKFGIRRNIYEKYRIVNARNDKEAFKMAPMILYGDRGNMSKIKTIKYMHSCASCGGMCNMKYKNCFNCFKRGYQ